MRATSIPTYTHTHIEARARRQRKLLLGKVEDYLITKAMQVRVCVCVPAVYGGGRALHVGYMPTHSKEGVMGCGEQQQMGKANEKRHVKERDAPFLLQQVRPASKRRGPCVQMQEDRADDEARGFLRRGCVLRARRCGPLGKQKAAARA